MKIGILTGGGDVPGLNPCIKVMVNRAIAAGNQVVGIRRGWAGLLNYDPNSTADQSEWIIPLTGRTVRTIDRFGGTFLHTSRTNPSKVKASDVPGFLRGEFQAPEGGTVDCTPHVLRVLKALGIDMLAPIGGDDTLSYAVRLHQEGVPVVGIPKTMDNDVYGTDYCIGFSTAVTRSVDLIADLRTPAGSHERIAVVELFGRNSGETVLIASYLSGADRAVIAEVPFDVERLATLAMHDRNENPSCYAVIVISEGATMKGGATVERGEEDAYGHRKLGGIGQQTAEALHDITGIEVLYQQLGYLMRGGPPDSLDRMVAMSYANLAIDLVLRHESGQMVALQSGVYTTVPLDVIARKVKRVDVEELYDVQEYRPKIAHQLGKPMFLY
ncbi:MAG TPA: ATP-dependent 6-phosphofructokinase [Chloroflexota bacterium]|nr:ATP-dependent 6-phosphofructokinase [Chloroflexota bacterium]